MALVELGWRPRPLVAALGVRGRFGRAVRLGGHFCTAT